MLCIQIFDFLYKMDIDRGFLLLITLYIIGGAFFIVECEKQEVCVGEIFKATCPDDSAIIMDTALYGQMRLGNCLEVDLGYLGCENDVLHLTDKWCSGHHTCDISVPNNELNSANTACNIRGLSLFLEVEYNCVNIAKATVGRCSSTTAVDVYSTEGYISSLVTLQTGCGSARAPWIIQVAPGQIVDLWLLDFGALSRHMGELHVICQQTLGYIIERHLGSNFTICADGRRRKHLYKSKTNKVEIVLTPTVRGSEQAAFLVQYSVIGCPDLTPPAHAWYKRDGDEAVIGCKSNDRVWRLYCNGNTWNGVVGNCSIVDGSQTNLNLRVSLSFSSVIVLTCVVCGAFLLIIIVIVAGSVYVKKQSIKHQIKLRSDYAFMTLHSSQYYTIKKTVCGVDATGRSTVDEAQPFDSQPLVEISDRTLTATTATNDVTLVPSGDVTLVNKIK